MSLRKTKTLEEIFPFALVEETFSDDSIGYNIEIRDTEGNIVAEDAEYVDFNRAMLAFSRLTEMQFEEA